MSQGPCLLNVSVMLVDVWAIQSPAKVSNVRGEISSCLALPYLKPTLVGIALLYPVAMAGQRESWVNCTFLSWWSERERG